MERINSSGSHNREKTLIMVRKHVLKAQKPTTSVCSPEQEMLVMIQPAVNVV